MPHTCLSVFHAAITVATAILSQSVVQAHIKTQYLVVESYLTSLQQAVLEIQR
jgi:hypothetical protein